MSGYECENILPSDATLLYRARDWSKLFMKYNKKDTSEIIDIFNENDSHFLKLIEEEKGENYDDDDATISDPNFVGSSSGDTNDNDDKVKNLLDKTLKVIEKRKDQWEKTGINNVLDTFCLEEIDNKVNKWLKTNENYLKLWTNKINSNNNNENIKNVKMKKKSKKQAEIRRNQSLNLNRCRRMYDEGSSSSSTNNSDENFNVTNNNRKLKKKYRMKNNKNKSYVLSSSLESVDTAQYILSNRKPYNKMKTKTNNMKIKRFCNTKNYQDKAEKRWKKLKLKSGSSKSSKLSVISVPLLSSSSRQHQIRKRKKILMINENNADNDDESDYDDSSENDIEEETDSDDNCISNGEKCYLIPKKYFKGSSHSHDKRIKSKNLYGGGSDYHHYHHHSHRSDTAVAIIKSADCNLINRQSTNHRIKMKSLKQHKCRGGGGGEGEEAATSNKSLLYNSNLMYHRRTPSPQVSHINEIRLIPPLPSPRPRRLPLSSHLRKSKSPSQKSFFNYDDLISDNFNPDKHSTEILNFDEMNCTKQNFNSNNNNNDNNEMNISTITDLPKKIGRTKLSVIHSPLLSCINKTIQSSRNSITENSCNTSICSTITSRSSSKIKLTKKLLEETIGKNYTEQIFNNGYTNLTKYKLNADSEILFEPPLAEEKNYKSNIGNCNDDDDDEDGTENSDDNDTIYKLYRPKRGRIYEVKSLESSPLSTTIKRK